MSSYMSFRAAQETGFDGYPDDDDACIQHGNRKDDCAECIADFQREEAEFRAWRATQPAPMATVPDDLPF